MNKLSAQPLPRCGTMTSMAAPRDHQLVWGGLLIGLALGLCFGLLLLIVAVQSMMHHMFIVGVAHWNPITVLFASSPFLMVTCGAILLRRGMRNTHDR